MAFPSDSRFEAPIPQKAGTSLNSHYSISPSISPVNGLVPPLEELLDDCFKHAIGHPLTCSSRENVVKKFEKYLNDLHTQENLLFLIEIFKYEYYYDKIFPNTIENLRLQSPSPIHYSNSFLNRSLDKSINHLPYPTKSKKPRSASLVKVDTVRSEELEPTSVFVSTIDDLGTSKDDQLKQQLNDSPIKSETQQLWEDLKDQNISDLSDTEDNTDEELSEEDRDLLVDQWDLIVRSYIVNDAPEQINISQKSSREILEEDACISDRIHSPVVLVRAKNEILQLLKENAYPSFTKKYKKTNSEDLEKSPNILIRKPSTTPVSFSGSSHAPQGSPSSLSYASSPSPLLGPVDGNLAVPKIKPKTISVPSKEKLKKSRFLHLSGTSETSSEFSYDRSVSPPSSFPNKPVSQSSSISNLLGHLKIHHHTPSPSTNNLPHAKTTASLSNSPVHTRKISLHNDSPIITPPRPASAATSGTFSSLADSDSPSSSRFGKIWKKKK